MPSFRSTLAATVALAMTATAMAATHHRTPSIATPGNTCVNPDERTAFELEGLKSELMVTALTCHDERDRPFLSRYGHYLGTEESLINAYFKRLYGRSWQSQHDAYITNLANVQSQDMLKAGTAFCQNLPVMFDEVMSLHDETELVEYAEAKPIVQPISLDECTGAPPVKSVRKRSKKHA